MGGLGLGQGSGSGALTPSGSYAALKVRFSPILTSKVLSCLFLASSMPKPSSLLPSRCAIYPYSCCEGFVVPIPCLTHADPFSSPPPHTPGLTHADPFFGRSARAAWTTWTTRSAAEPSYRRPKGQCRRPRQGNGGTAQGGSARPGREEVRFGPVPALPLPCLCLAPAPALLLPRPCLAPALPLPLPRLCLAFALPLPCPSIAATLPLHCPYLSSSFLVPALPARTST